MGGAFLVKVPFPGLPRTASAGGEAGESASAEQEWADCRRRHFFMAYATLDQLVSLFGADEIRTLSDRQGTGELDEAVISDALERASSEVDSYLADRYATPLSGSDPIPPVVVSVTGDIARYRLTGGDIRDTDPIRERYTKALNWLRDVADGKAGIPGLPPAGTETPGAVLLEPGTRPWDGVTP